MPGQLCKIRDCPGNSWTVGKYVYVQNLILITSACVVLHKLCEMYNDNCISEWTVTEVGAGSSTSSTAVCLNANTIRDAIATYLYSDN